MLKKLLLLGSLTTMFVSVYAMTPTLSLSNSGSGDTVLITVHGDPNGPVSLSFYSTVTSGLQTQVIGNTSSDGSFWTTISTSGYNVSSNGSVYVTVAGQQSPPQTWPYTNTGSASGVLTLSQTGLVLSIGQTQLITATNASSLYLFNNTNPSVVNVSLSNNQISVSANANGSTVFTVCSGSSSNCASVYVTVQNSGAQLLTFSQSNVTVTTGQTLSISVYGGSGNYTLVSNSNNAVVQASLSGSTLNLTGNSGSGQTSLTICTTDMSSCGVVNVSIGTTSSTATTLSQTSPTLSIGQSLTVSLSGSSGSYTISSNSNSSSVGASISGSALTLYGQTYGTSIIVICSTTGSCASLTASVSTGGGGGALTLSQTSLVLVTGQTVGITVSGGSTPYSVSASQSGIVQSAVNSNVVTVTGLSAGTTSLSVCSSGGGCAAISVIVNTSSNAGSSNMTPGFSQSIISLTPLQSTTVSITGGTGYYLASNSNSSVASAVINGSSATITGGSSGSTVLTICQSTGQCNTITVNVGSSSTSNTTVLPVLLNPYLAVGQKISFGLAGGNNSYYLSSGTNSYFSANLSGSTLTLTGLSSGTGQMNVCSSGVSCSVIMVTVSGNGTVSAVTTPSSSKYIFTTPLKYGARGEEVVELQKRLHALGYFNGTYVAMYGDATVAAVKKLQKAHGLDQAW